MEAICLPMEDVCLPMEAVCLPMDAVCLPICLPICLPAKVCEGLRRSANSRFTHTFYTYTQNSPWDQCLLVYPNILLRLLAKVCEGLRKWPTPHGASRCVFSPVPPLKSKCSRHTPNLVYPNILLRLLVSAMLLLVSAYLHVLLTEHILFRRCCCLFRKQGLPSRFTHTHRIRPGQGSKATNTPKAGCE